MLPHYDPRQLGLSVSHYSGEEASCICPFHNDHRPSATFNIKTGLFYCFACGVASNAKAIAAKTGGTLTRTFIPSTLRRNRASDMPWHSLLMGDFAVNHPYLMERGVTNDQIRRYNIRRTKNAIIFPMYGLNGRVMGITMRRKPGLFPKYLIYGDKPPLWPLESNALNERYAADTVFIVEGIFGVLRAERAGIMAFSIGGAMLKYEAARILRNLKDVRGFFDDDDAGLIASVRLLQIEPTSRIILPGGEADELSDKKWQALVNRRTVRSFMPIVKRAYDPDHVRSHIKRRTR